MWNMAKLQLHVIVTVEGSMKKHEAMLGFAVQIAVNHLSGLFLCVGDK